MGDEILRVFTDILLIFLRFRYKFKGNLTDLATKSNA